MSVEDLQRDYLQTAMGMDVGDLTALSNGQPIPGKARIPSYIAVMALQLKKPMIDAMKGRQAAQEPKQPTVKDQVIADAADVGIAALPQTESVMPEQAMAAGGIVAFEEGGLTQDITAQLAELRRRRSMLAAETGRVSPTVSARGVPAVNAGLGSNQANVEKIKQLRELDTQIAQLESKFKTAQGREQTYLAERAAEMAPGIGFQAPAGLGQERQQQGQQGQQPPGAGIPSGGSLPNQSQAYADLASRLKAGYAAADEGAVAAQMLGDPMARARFGYTADELSKLYDPQAELLKGLPATRAAAREEIEKRYAGLKDIDERRRSRAEASLKEAEKESGRDIGIGLAGLGFKIATARPGTNQMQEAIDTGLQYITSAKKDLKAARKDYAKSQDLLDEAQALREVGKEKEADEKFNDALNKRMNFQNALTNAQVTNETAIRSGIGQAAGRQVSRQLEGLSAELNLSAKGLESEATRAYRAADIAKDYGVAGMYAASRLGGRSALEDKAQDNAKVLVDQWMKSPQGMVALAKDTSGAVLLKMQQQFYLQELAKLQGTTAPSGGGATGSYKVLGPE